MSEETYDVDAVGDLHRILNRIADALERIADVLERPKGVDA